MPPFFHTFFIHLLVIISTSVEDFEKKRRKLRERGRLHERGGKNLVFFFTRELGFMSKKDNQILLLLTSIFYDTLEIFCF